MNAAAHDDETSLLRLRNLRDLGGLPTRTSKLVVRPRCFFRSSSPSRFTPAEQRALASLRLRCVIDLRTTVEVGQSGSAPIALGAEVVHLPLFETARPNWLAPADQSPRATAIRYLEMLDDSRHALATVILRIACPESIPILISCSAGRDRTGIVVACLLDLLDVTEQAIATDYAHSDSFDPAGGRAHTATVSELLGLVRDRYDSVQSMLSSLGIKDGVIESFRRNLLVRQE
ncbi:MAG: tyrosine-protein phosphatase [Planctomycetia bacterium]|nr:tyrosine-protein phosphatase [Planctomycetia bacterium]